MRYNDLIDRIDGYIVGTLIVDNGDVYVETKHGAIHAKQFDVLNGDTYETYTASDTLSHLDDAGWPIMAGMYVRVRA